MKKVLKKVLPYLGSIVVLVGTVFIYKIVSTPKVDETEGKDIYVIANNEISFTDYDRINQGKYLLLFDGTATSIVNAEGKVVEEYNTNPIYMLKYYGTDTYSDYYYILGEKFILKKDSIEISSIKYDALDFDMRKSASVISLLDDKNILIEFNTSIIEQDPKNPYKKISKKITYAYVYNFEDEKFYNKFSSINGIGTVQKDGEDVYLLLTDEDNNYDLYSIPKHRLVLNKKIPLIGDPVNSKTEKYTKIKSTKYFYACGTLKDDVYTNCGLYDYEANQILSLRYKNDEIVDYDDDYYALKKGEYVTIYNYSHINKMSDLDYVIFAEKYVLTFKDEIMEIRDKKLTLINAIDLGISQFRVKDGVKSKNIELVDEGETIIVNIFDSDKIDEDKNESSEIVRSYIYSPSYNDMIKGRRIYPAYIDGDLKLFYSTETDGKSITKVYLYSKELEAFRVINLEYNTGNFKIIDKCSNGNIGYILDNNYTIYNPEYESSGITYGGDIEYNNSICNNAGDHNTTNTILFTKTNQKITYGQIRVFAQTKDNSYLIMYDGKLALFKKK